jgi:ABC-type transport system involved in multi-copper enzyme maturation permease subunit
MTTPGIVKIWAIATNTVESLVRNKVVIIFALVFAGVVLLVLSPLLAVTAFEKSGQHGAAQQLMASLLEAVVVMTSSFGSLVASIVGGVAVTEEIRSGTVLAVLARPVSRWQFLLGKFLGVELLTAAYTAAMVAFDFGLAAFAHQKVDLPVVLLFAYPLVRYTFYSALAFLLAMFIHPYVAAVAALLLGLSGWILESPLHSTSRLAQGVHAAAHAILPSTGLLYEEQFVSFTKSTLQAISWSRHAIALAYGLDQAAILILLGMWAFRKRMLVNG